MLLLEIDKETLNRRKTEARDRRHAIRQKRVEPSGTKIDTTTIGCPSYGKHGDSAVHILSANGTADRRCMGSRLSALGSSS